MIGCKVLCVLLICTALWLTVRLIKTATHEPIGVVPPIPEKERPHVRLYTPPAEEPARDPRFGSQP